MNMRWLLALLSAALLGLVEGLSRTGSRLLVVNEESSELAKYSKFWADLEGKLNNSSSSLQSAIAHAN